MTADDEFLIVPELVVVLGPWSFAAEYYAAIIDQVVNRITPAPAAAVNAGSYFGQGGYVEALCFLTGEHREYDKKLPRFGRVIPNENFYCTGGKCGRIVSRGAWQVGARYSWIDLNDNGIPGGRLDDITIGLNWFLNPNAKIQWNYSLGWRNAPGTAADGLVHGLGTRLAFDF
jgi:phosphate-selective porin OprO/OprP